MQSNKFFRLWTVPLFCLLVTQVHLVAQAKGDVCSTEFSGDAWLQDFSRTCKTEYMDGLERTRLVRSEARSKEVLEVIYPAGGFDASSALNWRARLPTPLRAVTLSYDVRFCPDFDFVEGGKLPGLGGGKLEIPSKPDGTNGWRARVMWRKGGAAVQYVYHMDMTTTYGQDFSWKIDGKPVHFVPGQWHRISYRVAMNGIGLKNGSIRTTFDGKEVFFKNDFRFTSSNSLMIDTLYFLTFFGGNSPSWAPKQNQCAQFDHLIISGE